jgi:hypothetical protein
MGKHRAYQREILRSARKLAQKLAIWTTDLWLMYQKAGKSNLSMRASVLAGKNSKNPSTWTNAPVIAGVSGDGA